MPVLTITAIDHTTGQITIPAHGQATGAGPSALFAASAGAAIPTGWAAVTDYFLIVLDANTVKLADSSAHALAGTAIANPADNGSATLELLIGLPYRVPMTAAPGAQIKSANDNSVWAVLVALWNLLTAQAQSIWSSLSLLVPLQLTAASDLKHAGDWPMPFSFAGYVLESGTALYVSDGFAPSAAVTAVVDLQGLRNGDVIAAVDFGIAEGTASWTYALCRKATTTAGSTAVIATGTINAGTVSITKRTLAAINHTVDSTYGYFLKVTTSLGDGISTGGTVHITH